MNHGSCDGPLVYSSILNPLHIVSEFCLDSINPLTIQFQYLELFSLFLLIVRYPANGKKQMTLFGALNHFRNVMRLSISSIIWLLGFSVANIMDSSFDNIVMDLLSGSSREGYIKITSSFFILFSFGGILGMTFGMDGNWLVWANDSCNPQIWLSIADCPWP